MENDYRAASHAQNILEQAGIIAGLLNDSENAVLTQLAQVERALTAWQRMDDSIADAEELNRQAIAQLQELLGTVQARAERVDLDPAQLRQLEDRLNLVQSLKRKYGGTVESVRGLRRKGRGATGRAGGPRRIPGHAGPAGEGGARRAGKGRGGIVQGARENRRAAGRKDFAGTARARLQQGAVPGRAHAGAQSRARRAATTSNLSSRRIPGEAARPLRAIASSGEMARVMLAVKTTLAEVDEIPILIFDEVDANVGGETAGQVGKKLRGLGRSHQVLCITHLPQVAAQGQSHFAVEKRVKQNRTLTELTRLEGAARQRELARMLGGQTEAALALAKSLLAEAGK